MASKLLVTKGLIGSGLAALVAIAGAIGSAHARTIGPVSYQTARPLPASQNPLPFGPADFSENWDAYATGSNAHGQGGWKGWANDPNVGALIVDEFSTSSPNSIKIEGQTDLIHEFDYNSGVWTITAQQYIPGDFAGRSYYIFQNVYNDQILDLSWSVQVAFDSATGNVENEVDAESPGALPYVTGEWVELMLVVDLDADTQTFYYGGQELYSGSWTNQFPNQATPGILEIGAIDLWANAGAATPVYYDDISIVAGAPTEFGVELAVDPLEGLGQPGDTVTYTVTVTNTGTSDDTFDIVATGVWTATPAVTSVAVLAGESATVDVDVEIPGTAVDGDSDTTTLTATSQGDPFVEASVDFTTTVGLPDTIFADGFDPLVP